MKKKKQIKWITCGDHWCDLLKLKLTNATDVMGVYVIWYGGKKPRYVRVGSGKVKDRIARHRDDTKITNYKKYGILKVTWAEVPDKKEREGIESYLGNTLQPRVGVAFPEVDPIPVNCPPGE